MTASPKEFTSDLGFRFKLKPSINGGANNYYIKCVQSNAYMVGLVDNCCFYQGKESDGFGTWHNNQWTFRLDTQSDGSIAIYHYGSGKYLWSTWTPETNIFEDIFNAVINFGSDIFKTLVDPLITEAIKLLPTGTIAQKVTDQIVNSLKNNALLQGGSVTPAAEDAARRVELLNCIIIFVLICISIMTLLICINRARRS